MILFCLVYNYSQVYTPPYSNSFDNPGDTIGWNHYALFGTDDWEMGIPNSYTFTSAHSSPNVWLTNLTGSYAANSTRALETPYFNLSDTTKNLYFSFYHKRRSNGSTGCYVEYTTNAGSNWSMLVNSGSQSAGWQTTSGFSGSQYSTFLHSTMSLKFLEGLSQDSVKFRFKYYTSSDNQAGWMIDDFGIFEEYNNLVAKQGDSIVGINSVFTEFTVNSTYTFQQNYSTTYNIQSDFYFSTDLIIDPSDIFLGSVNTYTAGSSSNWSNTFNLPSGLSAGTYYILYDMDVLNVFDEVNEMDNSSYAVMIIDSLYSMPYRTDFDTTALIWNNLADGSISTWKKGDPNGWHVEDPRSGANAWVSGEAINGYNNYLESPYLDFSNSANNVLCFWYRNSQNSWFSPSHKIQFSDTTSSTISFPQYVSDFDYTIPHSRLYTWDCHCKDISTHDGYKSVKVRFTGSGNIEPNNVNQTLIDDIYIGSPKPDIAIEGLKKNRFTKTTSTLDTLRYYLFNSGLANLQSTTTKFYWSNDSILDVGDILLGNKIEPVLADTAFSETYFAFSKPTNAIGQYYILYKADALDEVVEMREYDNEGYFEIYQGNQEALPYYNDFESNINGWDHNSTLGKDNWMWATPQGSILDTAFSGLKAFITSDTGMVSRNSRMHLLTPLFDLTQLQNPVLEFDLKTDLYDNSVLKSGCNIMYSIDGGAKWNLLDTADQSFKLMYYQIFFESISGNDIFDSNGSSDYEVETLYGKNLKTFHTENKYYGRDYEENYHYVLNISHLQTFDNIRFMIVFANSDQNVEGILLDNFSIKEAEIDLAVNSFDELLAHHNDYRIHHIVKIKNDNNYKSNASSVNVYCSVDSIFDAQDHMCGGFILESLRPYQNTTAIINLFAPANFGSYNYLILNIDPNDNNIESDESNNLISIKLNMDTSEYFEYPVLFDFNDHEINGWSWYNDGGQYHGHRFRHELVPFDPVRVGHSGEWFLDPIDQLGYSVNLNNYPSYYLETPTFDFSTKMNPYLEFDFLCAGSTQSSSSQGGNLQYSLDGGMTWEVVPIVNGTSDQNWYNMTSISSLNGEPGWAFNTQWYHAKKDLSFLSLTPNVKFRYRFKSKARYSSTAPQGFRLDNFTISCDEVTKLTPISICEGDSILIFNSYQNSEGNYMDTLIGSNGLDSLVLQQLYLFNSPLVSIDSFSQEIVCVYSNDLALPNAQPVGGNYTLNGDTIQIFSPSHLYAGSYDVIYVFSDTNSCIITDTASIQISECAGIESIHRNPSYSVFPNPNYGQFTISTTNADNDELSIEVYDVSSRLVYQNEMTHHENKFNISIPNCSSGIYYLKLRVNDNLVHSQKILIR